MAIGLIPYGKLAAGNFGINLDPDGVPLASVIEILDTVPSPSASENFPGRLVFAKDTGTVYVFRDTPSASWLPLDGIPVTVGNVDGVPPIVPTPDSGALYYDLDTEVLYIWQGTAWTPVGGRYAAQIIVQKYVGDGFDATFAMGTTVVVPSEYVEVFLDGIRQTPNPGGDYDVIGNNVVFAPAPGSGVNIMLRSLQSTGIAQNAQVSSVRYVSSFGQDTFSTGVSSVDPASIFVFVSGILKTQNIDYTIDTQNTKITLLVKTISTNARATTLFVHNFVVGSVFTIVGALESAWNNTFTVSNVPTSLTFDFTVLSSVPSAATPNPVLYFTPPTTNDMILLSTPLVDGEVVEIRSLKNVVVAPAIGEVNDIQSIGSGTSLYGGKVGPAIQLKTIVAGAGVTISSSGTEMTIAAPSAGGEANTASNVGAGAGIFKTKIGLDLQFLSLQPGENISIADLGDVISISAASGENNTGANLGTGIGLYAGKSATELQFKSITAGTQIVLTTFADHVEIAHVGSPLTATYDSGSLDWYVGEYKQFLHGLSSIPKLVQMRLVNVEPQHGYNTDDEVLINPAGDADQDGAGLAVVVSATHVKIRFGPIMVGNKDTAAKAVASNGNWNIRIFAFT